MPAAEIIMFDDYLVVYKQLGDLMFYVTGSLAENELILHAVLLAFYEATSTLLRYAAAAAVGLGAVEDWWMRAVVHRQYCMEGSQCC